MMFLLVRSKEDYIIYGGITVFAGAGANILNFLNLRHYISLKPCLPFRLTRHLKPILIFFALSIATTIYTNLDIIMLGFISGDSEVGYYNSAVKIKIILTSFVTSLGAVLMPRISYYVENGMNKKYMSLIQKAFDFVLLSALPLCVYFIVMARESILFLSGEAYSRSVVPMQIIMPTVLFIGLTNIIGIQLLVPLGKEKLVFLSTCIGAVADTILNAVFIPRYGSIGAAIGTVTAELVVLIIQLWMIAPKASIIFSSLQLHKVLIALIPSTVALSLVRALPIPGNLGLLLICAISFFGVYGLILLLLHYHFNFR